jgi:hypothetical protein
MAEPTLSHILEDVLVRCRKLEAPLADRLQAFANELRRLGPHFAEAIDALVKRLAETDAGANAQGGRADACVLAARRGGTARSLR